MQIGIQGALRIMTRSLLVPDERMSIPAQAGTRGGQFRICDPGFPLTRE